MSRPDACRRAKELTWSGGRSRCMPPDPADPLDVLAAEGGLE